MLNAVGHGFFEETGAPVVEVVVKEKYGKSLDGLGPKSTSLHLAAKGICGIAGELP
jgi:hypothetical protein